MKNVDYVGICFGVVLSCGIAGTAAAAEIPIGVALPLTGPVATFAGVTAKNGVDLAVHDVNQSKELGNDVLKPIIEDIASDKNQAITVVNRLIEGDHVPVVIGPTTTVFAAAVAPIANSEKTPILTIGLSPSINKSGPYAFKMFQDPDRSIALFTHFAVDKAHVKNFAAVYNRDNDAYVTMDHETVQDFRKSNVPVLSEDSISTSDTDFTALAAKIVAENPDAIFFNTVAEQAANLMIQLRQAGLPESTKIFGFGAGFYPQYPRIGGKAVDGTYILSHYDVGLKNPQNEKFVAEYKAMYKSAPDEFAAMAYTAVRLAAAAIRAEGPDRSEVRDYLTQIKNVPTVLGAGKFTFADRSPQFGAAVLQLENGEPVLKELVQ